jgi:CheY-like chemotaxis protein
MKKILLVEDDVFLVKVYKSLLEKEGYSVIVLTDGVEVIDTVRKERPDLVILDLIMPGKDGFDVLGDLKGDSKTKNIPVYVLTVLRTKEDIKKVKNLGADEYIVKSDSTFKDVAGFVKRGLS